MSKKQLVVAEDVRAAAKSGNKVILLRGKVALVTAEARSVAQELGVDLKVATAEQLLELNGAPAVASEPGLDVVRRVIEAHTNGPASDAVMKEVMRRIEGERRTPSGADIRKITSICTSPRTNGNGTNMSQLDLTSMGATTASPCASGFMGWAKNTFSFKRASDEVNLVLEGELQFHIGQEVISAKAGDVMWIPKGVEGKIGTPTSVRYFYLSYPV